MKNVLSITFFIFFFITNIQGQNVCNYIQEAGISKQTNDIEKAISYLKKAQKEYPNNIYKEEIALKLGKLYFDSQELEKAKKTLLKIDISERQKQGEFPICHNNKIIFFKDIEYWNPILPHRIPQLLKQEIKYLTCILLKKIEIQQNNYSKAIMHLDQMTNIHFLSKSCGNAIRDEQTIYQLEKTDILLLKKDTINALQTLGCITPYSKKAWKMIYQIWRKSYSRDELQELFLSEIQINSKTFQEKNHCETQSIFFLDIAISINFYNADNFKDTLKILYSHPLFRFINNDINFMIQEYMKTVYLSNNQFIQEELSELLLLKYSKKELKKAVINGIEQLKIQQNRNKKYCAFTEIPILDYKLCLYEKANSKKELNDKLRSHPFIQKMIK